jgi:hypothetical protein
MFHLVHAKCRLHQIPNTRSSLDPIEPGFSLIFGFGAVFKNLSRELIILTVNSHGQNYNYNNFWLRILLS